MLCRSAQIDICVGTLFNELPGDFDPTNGEHRCQHIREGIGAAYSWWGVDSSGVESDQSTLRNFHRCDDGVFSKIPRPFSAFWKIGHRSHLPQRIQEVATVLLSFKTLVNFCTFEKQGRFPYSNYCYDGQSCRVEWGFRLSVDLIKKFQRCCDNRPAMNIHVGISRT